MDVNRISSSCRRKSGSGASGASRNGARFPLGLVGLLVGAVALVQMAPAVEAVCPVAPQFWCDDLTVAKQCGVLDQCMSYAKGVYAKPVQLVLYYESLCPDCTDFIRDQLYPLYYTSVMDVLNISFVPFGNAQESWDDESQRYIYTCQHGHPECVGNVIETCAINLMNNNITAYFPLLSCMELSSLGPVPAAKDCASQLGVDIKPILECSTSKQGNDLEHKMATKTSALIPTHTSVPWFTYNGVHTQQIQDLVTTSLMDFVCDNYVGPSKPVDCDNGSDSQQ